MTGERDDLAAAAERAARIYAEFARGLSDRRVDPGVGRDAMTALFEGTIGEDGIGLDRTLDDFERMVLPHAMTTPHPRYAGLVNSSPLPMGPLADLLVSALNNNNGAFHQSPPATGAEVEVVRTFATLLGCDGAVGMLLPGGTFANLHGLLLARARHFPDWRRRGAPAGARPRLYTSAAAHFSIARAAQVAGIGEDDVVAVPVRGRGAIDVAALAGAIAADRAAGRTPFAVAGTLGTTGTGAIDDLAALADLCERERLWLHVDACYGGAAALVDELRPRLAGLGRADSIAVDAHKWFLVPITAGLILSRHPEVERAAFGVDAPYIPGDPSLDAYCRGVPTSRRASGLVTWAVLRAHGLAAVRDVVRRNVAQCRLLERLLARDGFRVLDGGELSIACARWEPTGHADLDAVQGEIAGRVVASGAAWFATTRHAGATWLRFNLVNAHTTDADVAAIAAAVVAAARG